MGGKLWFETGLRARMWQDLLTHEWERNACVCVCVCYVLFFSNRFWQSLHILDYPHQEDEGIGHLFLHLDRATYAFFWQVTFCGYVNNSCCLSLADVDATWGNYRAPQPPRERLAWTLGITHNECDFCFHLFKMLCERKVCFFAFHFSPDNFGFRLK